MFVIQNFLVVAAIALHFAFWILSIDLFSKSRWAHKMRGYSFFSSFHS